MCRNTLCSLIADILLIFLSPSSLLCIGGGGKSILSGLEGHSTILVRSVREIYSTGFVLGLVRTHFTQVKYIYSF